MIDELKKVREALLVMYRPIWKDAAITAKPLSCSVDKATAEIVAYHKTLTTLDSLLQRLEKREAAQMAEANLSASYEIRIKGE